MEKDNPGDRQQVCAAVRLDDSGCDGLCPD